MDDRQLWSWVDRDAPELAAHLGAHPEDRARVEALRAGMGAARIPDRIGPYAVRRLLGAGAMGAVYEAEQPSPRRLVAVKVIHGALSSDPARVALFRREAEALGRIAHPGIATIYEAGVTEDGNRYIAMELVRGEPLDAFVRRTDPSRPARLDLFRRVAEAVHHAHGNGVIHRDLKPSNVLVDGDGRAKVVDFGLARVAGIDANLSATATGRLVGTLAYMSPEQVSALGGGIDGRSDVYSLGVILYELLAGRLPFDVDSEPLPDALRAIARDPPPPPSRFDRTLRGPLETILLKALEKEPQRRYASAADLADDVARFLDGRSIVARPLGLARRLARHRTSLGFAAAAAALLYAGVRLAPERRPVDLRERTVGAGFPELSPFDGLRWRGTVPEVLVGGRWYELVSVEDVAAELIVASLRNSDPDIWRKRFGEDLVQALWRLTGADPGTTTDLRLRDPEAGAVVELRDVPMTEARRDAIRDANARRKATPFDAVRFQGDVPVVRVRGRWFELVSLDGLAAGNIVAFCRARYGDSWSKRFGEHLDWVLEGMGREPGETAALELRDLATGEIVLIPAAEKRREWREAIRRARGG